MVTTWVEPLALDLIKKGCFSEKSIKIQSSYDFEKLGFISKKRQRLDPYRNPGFESWVKDKSKF